MGVDKPNYTQIPNLLLDDLLMLMSDAEMKVTLAIARRTFGYHRDKVEISISQLQEITHLSKQGVINGINAGLERGTITRSEGKRGGFVYELIINGEHPSTSQPSGLVNQVDRSSTSQRSRPPLVNFVDITSQPSRQVLVNEVDINTPTLKKVLKKELKKGKETPRARSRSGDVHPNTQPIMEAYIEALGYKPGNYGQESSAAKTLAKQGYEPVDIVAAYQLLKQQPFWQTKHLSLQTLVKEIPALKQALLNGVPLTRAPTVNGNHKSKGEKQNDAADEAFRILRGESSP